MKETKVGEIQIFVHDDNETIVRVSVCDWEKDNVTVRLDLTGDGFGFYIDFAEDVEELVSLLEAARLVRDGAVACYSAPPKPSLNGATFQDGTLLEDLDVRAVRRILNARFEDQPGAEAETARRAIVLKILLESTNLEAALASARVWLPEGSALPTNSELLRSIGYELGDEVVTQEEIPLAGAPALPAGTRGVIVGMVGTLLAFRLADAGSAGELVYISPVSLVPRPAEPAVQQLEVGDTVLAGENLERLVPLGTVGRVIEHGDGSLGVDWDIGQVTPLRRKVRDQSKLVRGVPARSAAAVAARIEADD
jgi:hypothetical protein